MNLVASANVVSLTRDGQRIATQDHQHGGQILARTLIQSGVFADQIRRLSEITTQDDAAKEIRCDRREAIECAAQLVGLLRRFPGVGLTHEFRAPFEVAELLMDVWAMLPIRADLGKDPLKAIGDRGELYSYQFERAHSPTSAVRWAARDDETLGYDIENHAFTPPRYIDAKASGSTGTRFFLSENEWSFAQSHENYEIQFWGGVSLTRKPSDEYQQLIRDGFPRVYRDLPALIREGILEASAVQYIVRETLAENKDSSD